MWKSATCTFFSCYIGMLYFLLGSVTHCDPIHIQNLTRIQRQLQNSTKFPPENLFKQMTHHGLSTTNPSIKASSPKDSSEEENRKPPKNVEEFLDKQGDNVASTWDKFKERVKNAAVGGAYRTKENFLSGIIFIGEGVNFYKYLRKTFTGYTSKENGETGNGCSSKRESCTNTSKILSVKIPKDVEEREEEKENHGQEDSYESDYDAVVTEDGHNGRKRKKGQLTKTKHFFNKTLNSFTFSTL